jgi:hypothetical protein
LEMNCKRDWRKLIPCCPKRLKDLDSTWSCEDADQAFHPGAEKCCRKSGKPSGFGFRSGQQCCYSDGDLIAFGAAAGTPDYYAPPSAQHLATDVEPFNRCGWAWYHLAGWYPDPGCKE